MRTVTLTTDKNMWRVDCDGGPQTVVLPASSDWFAARNTGFLIVGRIDACADNAAVLAGQGSDTINGGPSVPLGVTDYLSCRTDGVGKWFVTRYVSQPDDAKPSTTSQVKAASTVDGDSGKLLLDPLKANGEWESDWFAVTEAASIETMVNVQPPAATGTFQYLISIDKAVVDSVVSFAVPAYANGPMSTPAAVGLRAGWVKVRYANGPTAQTVFRLATYLSPQVLEVGVSRTGSGLTPAALSHASRSATYGQKEGAAAADAYALLPLDATGANVKVTVSNPSGGAFGGTVKVSNDAGSPLPVSGTVTAVQATGSNLHVSVDNLPAMQVVSGNVGVTGSVEVANDAGNPLPVSGTVTVTQPAGTALHATIDNASIPVTGAFYQATQPVSGTVTVSQATGASLHTTIDNLPATQPVSGSVTVTQGTGGNLHTTVDNFPTSYSVAGTVTVTQPTGTSLHAVIDSGAVRVTDSAGNTIDPRQMRQLTSADVVTVANIVTGSVSIANGSVNAAVSNFPSTQVVSGSVAVSNLPATQPVSGTVSVTQATGGKLTTVIDSGTVTASVTNFPASQTVSGTVGVNNFPASQAVTGAVSVTNLPATQTVSGSVGVSNFPASQVVSGTVTITDPLCGGTAVTVTNSLAATAATAGQVVCTYTVPAGKTLYLLAAGVTGRLTTLPAVLTALTDLGVCQLKLGSTVAGAEPLVPSANAGLDRADLFAAGGKFVPVAAGTVVQIVVNPASALTATYYGHIIGVVV